MEAIEQDASGLEGDEMALSGTITGTTSNKNITAKIVWSATQSIANNQSKITAKLYYKKGSSTGTTYGTFNGSITIGGSTKTISDKSLSLPPNSGDILVDTYVLDVTHNADGTKSVNISASGGMKGTSFTSTSCSNTVTLDTIPRQANITAAPNFNDEENPIITYSNSAGNVVTTLQACISNADGSVIYAAYRDIDKNKTSYTFPLTDAEREALRKAFPSSNSGTVRFYVKTVLGGNTYYSYSAKTFSIINANPTLAPTVEDTDTKALTLTGDSNVFIKYYSNAQISTGAAARKNTTLKSQKVTCGAKSISTATGLIGDVESATFIFSATDNRGNTTTQTVNKTLINYVKLTCNLDVPLPSAEGETALTITGNYFDGSFGTVSNTLTVEYRVKENNGDYGAWTAATATKSGNTYRAIVNITGLDYQKYYTYQARAIDQLATVNSSEEKVKTLPVFDWGESDFNFNVPVKITDGSKVYNVLGLCKAMSAPYQLEATTTSGSNYTVQDVSAWLMGNTLRCHFYVQRNSATETGNITNEKVLSYRIKHDGKIESAISPAFGNGTTGGIAQFYTTNLAYDDTYITFDVELAATGGAYTQFGTYFAIPVALNLDKY